MNILRHLPNLLTVLNLVCGCLGILNLWKGDLNHTAYYVWAAGVFDFFDGFAARLLRVSSPIGKDLDSLADMVSFGLLPSLFMYRLMESAGAGSLCYVAILIAVCSALRLAVFNNDESQSDSFRGVPTPANTLFLTGLPFLEPIFPGFIHNPVVLAATTVLFSVLLVSRFELFALKFKSFGWAGNKLRYSFLLIAIILLALLKLTALPLIIILYIGMSLGSKVFTRKVI